MNVLVDWNLDDHFGGHRIDPYCGCRVRHARLLLDLVLSLVVIGRPVGAMFGHASSHGLGTLICKTMRYRCTGVLYLYIYITYPSRIARSRLFRTGNFPITFVTLRGLVFWGILAKRPSLGLSFDHIVHDLASQLRL